MYFATPMLTSGQSLVIYDSDSDVSFGQQPSVSLRRSNRHDPMTDHIEAKNNSHPRSEIASPKFEAARAFRTIWEAKYRIKIHEMGERDEYRSRYRLQPHAPGPGERQQILRRTSTIAFDVFRGRRRRSERDGVFNGGV
jgi:hypothetical protein